MPRYYLHADRGDYCCRDYQGAEFPDFEAALRNATAAAMLLIDEGTELGEDRSGWSFTIADDDAHEVARVDFRSSLVASISRQ